MNPLGPDQQLKLNNMRKILFFLVILLPIVSAEGLILTPLQHEINIYSNIEFDLDIPNIESCNLFYGISRDEVFYNSNEEIIENSQKIRRNLEIPGYLESGYVKLSIILECINKTYTKEDYIYIHRKDEKTPEKYIISFNLVPDVQYLEIIDSQNNMVFNNIFKSGEYIELYEGNYTIKLSKKNYIEETTNIVIDKDMLINFKLEKNTFFRELIDISNLYKFIVIGLLLLILYIFLKLLKKLGLLGKEN